MMVRVEMEKLTPMRTHEQRPSDVQYSVST